MNWIQNLDHYVTDQPTPAEEIVTARETLRELRRQIIAQRRRVSLAPEDHDARAVLDRYEEEHAQLVERLRLRWTRLSGKRK
jgi:hypothetical protein